MPTAGERSLQAGCAKSFEDVALTATLGHRHPLSPFLQLGKWGTAR